MPDDFSIIVDQSRLAIPVVSVTGEIDIATAPELLDQLLTLSEGRPVAIVVDLTEVGFLDSSGIDTLAQSYKHLRAEGGRLIVVTSSPLLLRLFEITGTDRAFRVVPTLAGALDTIQ